MGLAYYSGASYEQKANQGMIILNTEASCNNKGDLDKIFTQYGKNIAETMNGQITSDELVFAKNKIKGYLKSCFDDKSDKMFEKLHSCAFDANIVNSLANIDEILDSITIQDIQNAANYVFNNNSQKIIIAKQTLLDENADYIKTLGSVEKR
ncbi:MAG: hypothetical protein IKL52_04090 [Candidatus Gastranaerophilales bacterium]|nr:hypothetical protein [Candidatus Gastranaerophilales bacterium]